MFSGCMLEHWRGFLVIQGGLGFSGGAIGLESSSGVCQSIHDRWDKIVDLFSDSCTMEAREGYKEAFVNC